MYYTLLFSWLSLAGTFELVGPCSETPVLTDTYSISESSSVGNTSVAFFEKHKIPYIGSELGFQSILNTPTDKAAIEWLGPKELRAYGWCYEVDGFQPEVMPNDLLLTGKEKVKWFFAFSHYRDGIFLSQCEPSFKVKSKKFCQ